MTPESRTPYYLSRCLFSIAFMASWVIASSAKDHTLRRGGFIGALIASIGSLVALEMQWRAIRKQGGNQ